MVYLTGISDAVAFPELLGAPAAGAVWDAATLLSSATQIPSEISLLVDSALLYHANKDIDGPILVIKGSQEAEQRSETEIIMLTEFVTTGLAPP